MKHFCVVCKLTKPIADFYISSKLAQIVSRLGGYHPPLRYGVKFQAGETPSSVFGECAARHWRRVGNASDENQEQSQ